MDHLLPAARFDRRSRRADHPERVVIALNLYSVRVGSVGSFFVAAVDQAQARAIGEQWKAEKGIAPSSVVRIDRFADHRVVYAPGV